MIVAQKALLGGSEGQINCEQRQETADTRETLPNYSLYHGLPRIALRGNAQCPQGPTALHFVMV